MRLWLDSDAVRNSHGFNEEKNSTDVYFEMGQQSKNKNESSRIIPPSYIVVDEKILVSRLGQVEPKLSVTSNSLVSPAELDPTLENDDKDADPRTIDPVDPNAIVLSMDPSPPYKKFMPLQRKSSQISYDRTSSSDVVNCQRGID